MSSMLRRLAIRGYTSADWQTVRSICLEAFQPIHEGFARALGTELFSLVYPDWKASSESYLRSLCETRRAPRNPGRGTGWRRRRLYPLRTNAVAAAWKRSSSTDSPPDIHDNPSEDDAVRSCIPENQTALLNWIRRQT
jgi:hypothetical protein